MRIQWTPSLSVGIDEIDRQQRDLFAAADRLVSAAGASDRELEAIVRRLAETARAQFDAEERWLRAADDPAVVRHEHEHRRFLDDLLSIADHLARGDRAAVDRLDVAGFVGAWLTLHVTRSDRDVARAARAAVPGAGAFPVKPGSA